MKSKILCFAGSLRRDSLNKKLATAAAKLAEQAGAEVTYIDLKDLPMPIYDGDIETSEGLPENAKKFKALLKQHDGLLISAPEYNSSISGVLKNAIDWASRPLPGEGMLASFDGKVAGLLAASPGALGGLRGLVTLRSILGNIKVIVIPDQFALSTANEAFDEAGQLTNQRNQQAVNNVVTRLVEVTGRLAAQRSAT
jgi:chromate reductase